MRRVIRHCNDRLSVLCDTTALCHPRFVTGGPLPVGRSLGQEAHGFGGARDELVVVLVILDDGAEEGSRGAALVEYGLLIAGVSLISAAAVAIFGHKTNDLVSATATVLPGAHADDNGPIASGKIIETTGADTGQINVDVDTIIGNTDTPRLGNNLGVTNLEGLILEQ